MALAAGSGGNRTETADGDEATFNGSSLMAAPKAHAKLTRGGRRKASKGPWRRVAAGVDLDIDADDLVLDARAPGRVRHFEYPPWR